MPILINPLKLDSDHKTYLKTLFAQQDENFEVYPPQQPFEIKVFNPRIKKREVVQIQLTHTVYRRHCESRQNRGEVRYDIVEESEKAFSHLAGSPTRIYRVKGTLKQAKNTLVLSTKKDRLAKVVGHPYVRESDYAEMRNEAFNEVLFTNQVGDVHMKKPSTLNYGLGSDLITYSTMRRIEGREVFDHIADDRSGRERLSTEERINLTLACLRALKHVHDKKIIHRDIKLENIIYDKAKNIATVIDYELSKDIDSNDNSYLGTRGYIPKEICKEEVADKKSDVYSLGIAMSIIWGCGDHDKTPSGFIKIPQHHFYQPNLKLLFSSIRHDLNEKEKSTLRALIEKMAAIERSDRPTLKEAIKECQVFSDNYKALRSTNDKSVRKLGLFKRNTSPAISTEVETKLNHGK